MRLVKGRPAFLCPCERQTTALVPVAQLDAAGCRVFLVNACSTSVTRVTRTTGTGIDGILAAKANFGFVRVCLLLTLHLGLSKLIQSCTTLLQGGSQPNDGRPTPPRALAGLLAAPHLGAVR